MLYGIFVGAALIFVSFQIGYHATITAKQQQQAQGAVFESDAAFDLHHLKSRGKFHQLRAQQILYENDIDVHTDVALLYAMQSSEQDTTKTTTTTIGSLKASSAKPPKCSGKQLRRIKGQLPPLFCIRQKEFQWMQGCSFTVATKCPKQTWVERFYAKQAKKSTDNNKPFVGISVGCNKAFDAIETMRMGSLNAKFDKVTWGKKMMDNGVDLDISVCNQNSTTETEQVEVGGTDDSSKNLRLGSEMHCIEPMPLTYEILQRTANELDLEKHGFTVTNAAIGKTSGTVLFPKANLDDSNHHNRVKVGTENKGMDSCFDSTIESEEKRIEVCQDVNVFSLDDYVSKYVKSEGPIHMMSIDVEGYDFDVLLGGREALKRTHYVEFEYNWMGSWKQQHLEDAIKMLDEEGFTCYWAGRDRLWRITDCWQEYYDIHQWSNVACANRSQYTLAKDMEDLFLKTLQKKEVYWRDGIVKQRGERAHVEQLYNMQLPKSHPDFVTI